MNIQLDISNILISNIGKEHGLSLSLLKEMATQKYLQTLKEKKENGTLGFYDLPYDEEIVDSVLEYVESIKGRFDNYVHIGIGGSSLGPIALFTSLQDSYYNLDQKPRLFFPDNIDPDWINDLLSHIDIKRTLFHVVSKSGGTAETAATLLHFMGALKEKTGENFYKNLIFTTDPHAGLLNKIAAENPIRCFRIPANVGGRFSVFTPLGLIPAALAGIDIRALLHGAAEMEKKSWTTDLMQNPAFIYAAIHTSYMQKGKNISVMMPYSNKLRDIADWYRQMWAESLGKRFDNSKNKIEVGQTPVKALGATDQHSQVQLYVEGPNDKIITFLEVENFQNNLPLVNHFPYIPDFDYLAGKSLGLLLNTEKQATELALTRNERPNITIKMSEVNAENIGALLFLFEAATAFAGEILNINAFDQPGVEEGKIATYGLMGRKGYEKKGQEIENALKEKEKHIIV